MKVQMHLLPGFTGFFFFSSVGREHCGVVGIVMAAAAVAIKTMVAQIYLEKKQFMCTGALPAYMSAP